MAIISSTVSFNVLFGTVSDNGIDAIAVPGAVPRPDGQLGCMYRIVPGEQTVPPQVFSNLYFQTYVSGGRVTVISPE
jgi:hypothetical protein